MCLCFSISQTDAIQSESFIIALVCEQRDVNSWHKYSRLSNDIDLEDDSPILVSMFVDVDVDVDRLKERMMNE